MKDAVNWEKAYEEEEENADVPEIEEKNTQIQGHSAVFEKIRTATKRNLKNTEKRRSSLIVVEENPLIGSEEIKVDNSRTATKK